MKNKHKKGFLLAEETLKIVIAIIAIGFLVYFLVSLYFSYRSSKELDQAQASLDYLISQVKAGSENVDIYNPKNWWVFSEDDKLCICKTFLSSSCEEDGKCSETSFMINSPIQIENPPITLNIDQTTKEISKG